jgi:Flp pilus assembly protein TadD
VTILRSAGLLCALMISTSAFAQAVDESALEAFDRQTPKVPPVISEPAGAVELRSAMRRISVNPSDADALADAGNASLVLGDANAALNFFTRANALRPGNSRIVSGLATATVRTENPFEALRLFDDAVRLGANERSIAIDRALAFDLLGNFDRAQQDYKLARTAFTSDDLIIRQSVSLALAGQKEQADAMLVPLLERKSASAWRARAFMLAARGELRESTKVAQGFMDGPSAERMERFFRLMPNLTGAQQAAAIHLGHFPTSQYVGRDSEQVRRVAAALPQTALASPQNRLIPLGDPFGPKTAKTGDTKIAQAPDVKKDRKAQETGKVLTAVANIPASPKPAATLSPAPTAISGPVSTVPIIAQAETKAVVSAIMGAAISSPAPLVTVQGPTPAPTALAVASSSFDLGAVVASIEIPEGEQLPSQVPVDLKSLKPVMTKVAAERAKIAKVDAKIAAKAKLEKDNPARYWVQIAAGNAGALGFDYRKFVKKYPELLKKRNPFTAEWGKTDRLLVGPFADQKAAKKWEGDYKKGGGDAFMWKSEIGEAVSPLKTK